MDDYTPKGRDMSQSVLVQHVIDTCGVGRSDQMIIKGRLDKRLIRVLGWGA
jgi:hypothetical protein